MAINLTTKFVPYTDEMFSTESKTSLVTNKDLDWTGAHTVKVYKVGTSAMNDYDRNPSTQNLSRFGSVKDLEATTEEFTLRKDRSFTFAIDNWIRMRPPSSSRQPPRWPGSSARWLSRRLTDMSMALCPRGAGTKPGPVALTAENIADQILAGNTALDDAEVPETGRSIIVTPAIYQLMKKCKDIIMETDIGNDMRLRGVVAMVDGANVIKVPASRLPENFGFMIVHPVATVAPVKLEDYRIHQDPPGIQWFPGGGPDLL